MTNTEAIRMQREAVRILMRRDLRYFVRRVFDTVASGEFVDNWHIDAITYLLERCHEGEVTRALITQPPRSLKSICSSVAFPAWALGHDPSLNIVCVSYSQDLADDLARQFNLVVTSDWYRQLFPQMRLKNSAVSNCFTTQGGRRLATSVGGAITGRGADFIIIDDPMKADNAQSAAARRAVSDWYHATPLTRLNDKKTGVIIVVMQRLHENDLAQEVLQTGEYAHLDLPAIAIEGQNVPIGPGQIYHRKQGEVLQPEREPLEVLQRLRREMGGLRFSAQYQQRPTPIDGNLVKRTWFQTYETPPVAPHARIVQSWDLASSTSDFADYSACVTALRDQKKLYLIDIWRGRLTYPDLKAKIIAHSQKFAAADVLIEKAGPGLHLIQDFHRNPPAGLPRPISIKPDAAKAVRMEAASAVIERGDVFLPQEAVWVPDFLNELLGFPNASHDDQVDALSQLVNWIETRRGSLGPEAFMPDLMPKLFDLRTGREIPAKPSDSRASPNLYGQVIDPYGQEY